MVYKMFVRLFRVINIKYHFLLFLNFRYTFYYMTVVSYTMNDCGLYMYEEKGRKTENILQVPNTRHTLADQKFCLFYTLVSPKLGICGSCILDIVSNKKCFQ